jgi:hypothetical protein
MPVAALPDLTTLDADALRDMVLMQHQQISSHGAEIERLRMIIARLQRLQFGRKSEKIQRQIEQLELQLEDLEARTAEEQQQVAQTRPDAVSVNAAARKGRRALPEHLPREVQTSELLKPLNEALRQYVMSGRKLHADDTPVPVLAPGDGKTKLGRLWTYVRDDRPAGDVMAPAVWFAYSPDRRGEHPHRHLATFQGTLQADAYAGFNRLYDNGRIREAACWVHARRKFFDLQQAHASAIAAEAVERIGHLYAIENEIRGRSPDDRQRIRETRSRPLLTSLHEWLKASLTKLPRKSETAAAISYALGRWPALVRYCDDGFIEIDNNAAERALRAVALGRKNYLFAGSDSGGERAAATYSLIGSAKLNALDPQSYLRDVLARIADHPVNRITELLPWNIVSATAVVQHA